jgi:site-specific recombinase XerD
LRGSCFFRWLRERLYGHGIAKDLISRWPTQPSRSPLSSVGRGDQPLIAPRPKLLDQVRQAISVRHYSYRTEQTYVAWIKRFIFFHGVRHPAEMGEPEIRQFLSDLAVNKKVSASTQNQALNALLFLYQHVSNQPIGWVGDVVRAKRPKRLPVVLTRQEVKAILAQFEGVPLLVCTLLYGAGLLLSEALRIRVKDVDFVRNEIQRVEDEENCPTSEKPLNKAA